MSDLPQEKGLKALLKRSPIAQAVLAAITIIYLASPADLIPDIIPIAGYLDDLALLLTEISSLLMFIRAKKEKIDNNVKKANVEQDSDSVS